MLKHAKTCDVPDDADPSTVSPSDWNADHIIDAGGATFVTSTSSPAAPSAGKMNLFGRNAAGRDLLALMSASGKVSLVNSMMDKQVWMLQPASGTTLTTFFNAVGQGYTAAGSFGAQASYYGLVIGMGTSTSNNVPSILRSDTSQWNTSPDFTRSGGFTSVARLGFNTTIATNTRVFCGFTDNINNSQNGTGPALQDNATGSRIGFSFNTVRLPADANFFVTARNASGAETRIDTGCPFAISTLFDFWLFCQPGGTEVGWRIDNLVTKESYSGVVDSNIPGPALQLNYVLQSTSPDTTNRVLYVKKIYVENEN